IGLYRDAIEYLATGVRRLGQVLGECECRGIEAAWSDLPVWQRLLGGRVVNGASCMRGLATGAVERAEVAGERRGSGDKCGARGGVLANIGLLKTTEEEELVTDDLTSECASELIPLQAVLPGCEIIDRVGIPIAKEFKQVAMPSVGSGLGDHIDHAAWMQAVARRQRASLHAELGQRIGKGERHIDVGKAVIVVSTIQQVVGSV